MSITLSRLDGVCEVIMGQAPSGEAYNREGKGWALIAGAGDFGDVYPVVKKFTTEASKLSCPGDIILGIRATIGEKVLSDGEYCLGRGVAALRAHSVLDSRYLWYWLSHIQPQLASKAKGATFKQVTRQDIAELEIPLPPIAEQKRIAAILDKAESLRSLRRQAIAQLDSLTQSIFLEMFGNPATNPKGWDVCKVSDYVSTFQGGKNIDPEDEKTVTRNRVVKVSSVTSMVFRSEQSKPLPDFYKPPEDHFIKSGDLLFSRANTTELVGAVAYVQSTPENLTLADKVWRFVWKEPLKVDPIFIWILFQTPAVRHEISSRATGTSGSMKNISQPKTLSIPTILPPLSLQQEFARRVEAVEQLKATQRESLAHLDALFASLQHRAFRGEL